MPKIFGKEIPNYLLIVGVGVLGFLVFDMVSGGDPATRTKLPKPKSKKKEVVSQYTPEDYKATFAVLNEPVRNAFRPLIVKRGPIGLPIPTGGPIVLPLGWVGNQAGWAYTGYAEVDGLRQGLVENSVTGESVFLRSGQRWKALTVRAITAENMEVTGPDGTQLTIPVVDPNAEQKVATNVVPPGGVAPVNPGTALSGPIGGAAAQQIPGVAPGSAPGAAPGVDLRVQPDNSNNNGGGGRRRGRRGFGG